MSTCSLCRVTKTEEHITTGWHKFNEKLFKEGKMPIALDNYNNFERHRHESGDVTSTSTNLPSKAIETHNVNKWHWEELNLTRWATGRISTLLKVISIPVGEDGSIKIEANPTITGDAYVNTRKGRTFSGFEMKMDISFAADKGAFSGKGTCHLPEVSADIDDYDYEITNIKIEGDGEEKAALLDVFRQEGRKAIRNALKKFSLEIKDIAKNPSAYNPDEIGGSASESD